MGNREFLRKQMNDKRAARGNFKDEVLSDKMTTTEYQMNAELVRRIVNDEQVSQELYTRLVNDGTIETGESKESKDDDYDDEGLIIG